MTSTIQITKPMESFDVKYDKQEGLFIRSDYSHEKIFDTDDLYYKINDLSKQISELQIKVFELLNVHPELKL